MGSPAKFTSSDFQEICEVVFKVYDLDGTGSISKEEFTKMLYNFPKKEILKFYGKIFGAPDTNGVIKSVKERFNSELYESLANFNYLFDPNKGIDNDVSGVGLASVDDLANVSISSSASEKSLNKRKVSSAGGAGRGRLDDLLARKVRKNSCVDKILRHKVVPTNVSNQIAIWCDSIYEQYGRGDKLFFPQFVEWASIHKNFIFTFARYFRYTMWKIQRNPLTNREFLGFHKMTPVLQENIEIKFSNEVKFVSALGCLYIEFLFVWYDRARNVPNKIKILRDVGISFSDEHLEIHIAHYSPEYRNYTIRLGRKPVYLYWRDILTNYSR